MYFEGFRIDKHIEVGSWTVESCDFIFLMSFNYFYCDQKRVCPELLLCPKLYGRGRESCSISSWDVVQRSSLSYPSLLQLSLALNINMYFYDALRKGVEMGDMGHRTNMDLAVHQVGWKIELKTLLVVSLLLID